MVFAGVWLSNAPAGVLASYSVALLLAWAAVEERSLRPLWRGAGGLALGFGLTSFYLVPAAYEQSWVNIAQALSSGLLPTQNFLYTQISDPEHNTFNYIVSSVAVLLMAMTGIAAMGARRTTAEEQKNGETSRLWRVLLVLSVVAAVLMTRVSSIFWEHLPKLRFLQFPWRWMAILAVPYAHFMAAALSGRRRAGWAWGIAVLALIVGTATFLVHQAWWDSEDLPVLEEAIANDKGFEGTDEYDPQGDDHSNLPEKAPRTEILPAEKSGGTAPKAEIRIERWTAEERDLRVTTHEPSRAALRLLNYPAWLVMINGRTVTPQRAEGSSQMIFPIPAGESRIVAHFLRTTDRTLGNSLCVASVFALLTMVWARRKSARRM
jgi:tryptophan-rich sensory protein